MTYLGLGPKQLAAYVAGSVAVGVAIGVLLPGPTFAPECGYVMEQGVAIPAACESPDELAERLDRIRETHGGNRFDAYADCAAMLAADDWDAGTCWSEWPDLEAYARTIWGPDGDPETGPNR